MGNAWQKLTLLEAAMVAFTGATMLLKEGTGFWATGLAKAGSGDGLFLTGSHTKPNGNTAERRRV